MTLKEYGGMEKRLPLRNCLNKCMHMRLAHMQYFFILQEDLSVLTTITFSDIVILQ